MLLATAFDCKQYTILRCLRIARTISKSDTTVTGAAAAEFELDMVLLARYGTASTQCKVDMTSKIISTQNTNIFTVHWATSGKMQELSGCPSSLNSEVCL